VQDEENGFQKHLINLSTFLVALPRGSIAFEPNKLNNFSLKRF
jgi:hypothetical protein